MKILHVIPTLQKGGAERLCLDIVRALRKRTEVTSADVAILADANEYATEYPDIQPIVLKSKIVPSLSSKWTVDLDDWNNLLKSLNPDIIHSHLFAADLLSRYRVLPGKKYLSHCHDNMHQLAPLKMSEWFNKKRLTEAYERRFMLNRYRESANRFIAISRDTEMYFKSVLPADLAQNVHYLPNAIDTGRFAGNSAAFPVEGSPYDLVNIGSFVKKKNQAFLVDVMAHLTETGLPFRLFLVGDGPLRNEVQEKARAAGLEDRILFPGKISEVETLLGNSHLYVHAATGEPFGLVIAEAMAAGLPVVCLDGKGNRELMADGQNGYLLTEPDARLFAQKIQSIVSDRNRRENMATAARTTAARYDIGPYVGRLLDLYNA